MATRLLQIITFTNVAAAATVALPHTLNIAGTPVIPDFMAGDVGNFTLAATSATVTVTNNGDAAATINVWVERKHTTPRQLGGGIDNMTPQPFIVATGSGGGGGGGVGSQSFIFQPGGVEIGPVVFNSWTDLYTALTASRASANGSGVYSIVFDNSIEGNTVPAGAYDMELVSWHSIHGDAGDNTHFVQMGEGVVITNLHDITGITVARASGGATPCIQLDENALTLRGGAGLTGGTSARLAIVTDAGPGLIIIGDDAYIGGGDERQAAVFVPTGLSLQVWLDGVNSKGGADGNVQEFAIDDDTGGGQVSIIAKESSSRYYPTQIYLTTPPNITQSCPVWNYLGDPNGFVQLGTNSGYRLIDANTGITWRNAGGTVWVIEPPASGPVSPGLVFDYREDFITASGAKITEDLGAPNTGFSNSGAPYIRVLNMGLNGSNEGAFWQLGDAIVFGNFLPVDAEATSLLIEWGGGCDSSPTAIADFTTRWASSNLMSSSVLGGNGDGFGFSLGFGQNGNANWWGYLNDVDKVDLGFAADFNYHRFRVVYTIGVGVQWFIDEVLLGTLAVVPSALGQTIDVGANIRSAAVGGADPSLTADYVWIHYDYARDEP